MLRSVTINAQNKVATRSAMATCAPLAGTVRAILAIIFSCFEYFVWLCFYSFVCFYYLLLFIYLFFFVCVCGGGGDSTGPIKNKQVE